MSWLFGGSPCGTSRCENYRRRSEALNERLHVWAPFLNWEPKTQPWFTYAGPSSGTEPLKTALRRTQQVLAWFEQQPAHEDLARATRPESLAPDWPSTSPSFALLTTDIADLRTAVFDSVCNKRARLVGDDPQPGLLAGAKFLIYDSEQTVWDGASAEASKGLFDGRDEPGWATWIDFYQDHELGARLLCCIPPGLVDAAQAGIDANPVDCIRWIDCPELVQDPRKL